MSEVRNTITGLPVLTPVWRNTIAHQVYTQLRESIMNGRFSPDQKLTIRGLAEALGSSQMPIREALHRLQAENALEITASGRIRVPKITPGQLQEVRDARVALEGLLADRAAVRAKAFDISEISEIYDQLQAAVDASDQSMYLRINFAFHRRIYATSEASLTLKIVENLWLLIGPCFVLLTPDKAHLQRSMEAHARILEAMEKGDGTAARFAVAADIMQAAGSLAHLLATRAQRRREVS